MRTILLNPIDTLIVSPVNNSHDNQQAGYSYVAYPARKQAIPQDDVFSKLLDSCMTH